MNNWSSEALAVDKQPLLITKEIAKRLDKSQPHPSTLAEVIKLIQEDRSLHEFINQYCNSTRYLYIVINRDEESAQFCENKGLLEGLDYYSSKPLPLGSYASVEWKFLPNGILCLVTKYALVSQSSNSPQIINSKRYVEVGISAAELYSRLSLFAFSGLIGTFFLPILLIFMHALRRVEHLEEPEMPANSRESIQDSETSVPQVTSIDSIERAHAQMLEKPDLEKLEPKKVLELTGGTLVLFERRHIVLIDGETIHLTPKEHNLLSVLTDEPGRIYSDKDIIQKLWRNDDPNTPKTSKDVKQQIFLLRKKIKDTAENSKFVGTERSLGYKLLIRI
jgi:DNA-binding winged helix-turn-helix (wHTH) protein